MDGHPYTHHMQVDLSTLDGRLSCAAMVRISLKSTAELVFVHGLCIIPKCYEVLWEPCLTSFQLKPETETCFNLIKPCWIAPRISVYAGLHRVIAEGGVVFSGASYRSLRVMNSVGSFCYSRPREPCIK